MSMQPESVSKNFPPFDAIEQAFDSLWLGYARRAGREAENRELKVELRRTLIGLVADGITDAKELRRKAVEHLTLGPR